MCVCVAGVSADKKALAARVGTKGLVPQRRHVARFSIEPWCAGDTAGTICTGKGFPTTRVLHAYLPSLQSMRQYAFNSW